MFFFLIIYFRPALPSAPKYSLPPSLQQYMYPYFYTKTFRECDSDSLTCGDECDVVDAGSCHAVDRHASVVVTT